MRYEKEVYIQLYKLKLEMTAQIAALETAMLGALPKDDRVLDEITNLISVGYYDYPRNGSISDKLSFALKMLGSANVEEIAKYLKMLGENEVGVNELTKYLGKNLDNDCIMKYKEGIKVKYKLVKS